MSTEYEYDIAISFAGEDRQYAEELALIIKSYGLRVFYDQWEQDKLWGENLYDYFADVYNKKARYCVMFLSANYARKLWTSHERKMAQARAFREKKAYILPVRLDSTEIPGIPDTICYLDISSANISLADISHLILRKLGKEVTTADVDPIAYIRSAVLKVLQLDEENLFYYQGRYDTEKWEHHRDVLWNTIKTIVHFGDQVVPELTFHLESTFNRFLKRNILKILEMIGSKKATMAVCKSAHDPDAKVRNLAMLALQKFRDEQAIPTLIDALNDPDHYVRRNAVVAMKCLASESLTAILINVVKNEHDAFIQAHAIEGLGAIANEESIHFITGLINHPNEYVRDAAKRMLEGKCSKSP
jgi:hypothetical protein